MNKNIELCVKISEQEYQRLIEMAIDINPEEYIYKIVNKHLSSSLQANTHTPAITTQHRSSITDKKVSEFDILDGQLNMYDITQNNIADYLEVSQSSVSLFLRHRNKKSHLYPKFFTHPRSSSIIFEIYMHKYAKLFETMFKDSEQNKIGDFADNEELDTIIEILAVKAKQNFAYGFNVDVFLSNISHIADTINNIELEQIRQKNIEYINDKIDYLLSLIE